MKKVSLIILTLGAMSASAAPTLNYQGRITAVGANFTGFGFFKFVLIGDGSRPVWSNDGTTPGTDYEPGGSVTVQVNNGLFNVELGQGMTEISPLAFHQWGLFLRTWFSTNNVAFEELGPDVEVHANDLAHLNTGNMLIVASDGKADFDNIQDAVDVMATNWDYSAILVMPGGYEVTTPITIPTNRWIFIRGAGQADTVWIINNSGAALVPYNASLENIGIQGQPAITDVGPPSPGYDFRLFRCKAESSDNGVPAVVLMTPGQVSFSYCEIAAHLNAPALYVSGDAQVRADHSTFRTENGAAGAVEMDAPNPWCRFESCSFDTWNSSGPCLRVYNGSSDQSADFIECSLVPGVLFSNTSYGATFRDCDVSAGLLAVDCDANLTFRECNLDDGQAPNSRIRFENCTGWGNFRNCNMSCDSNPVFVVRDGNCNVNLQDCDLWSMNSDCVNLFVSAAGAGGSVNIRRSILSTYGRDAVAVSNDLSHAPDDTSVRLYDTEVYAQRDAIACNHGQVGVVRCNLRGERTAASCVNGGLSLEYSSASSQTNGVCLTNGWLYALYSDISGSRFAVEVCGPCEADLACCTVEADDGDGVRVLGTNVTFSASRSNIAGDSEDPALGRGVYASPPGSGNSVSALHSTLEGFGPGLECSGGSCLLLNSILYSYANAALLLRSSNTVASASACGFYGMTGGNTNAAIVLAGAATNPPPVPKIANSTIMCTSDPGTAPYSISLAGTITTGNVLLVNSVLSTNLDPRVGIVPVRTNLINGNIIL